MTIQSDKQKLSQDPLIALYQIDLNSIGVNYVVYFTPNSRNGGPVPFDGDNYVPLAMQVSGFTWDGSGSFPTPKLAIVNIAGTLTSIVKTYGGLNGATFRRIRTYEKHLDDGSQPDPGQIMPIDEFTMEQITGKNKIFIEWRLTTVIDETDRMLPARTCIRDYCPFSYRVWDGVSAFDYTHVRCPYVGTNYFDENDKSTTAANDKCSHTLNGCQKRFGSRQQLGFGGFPGVGRDKTF